MTEAEVRAILRGRCDKQGVAGMAERIGVTAPHLYDVLAGRRPPGPKLLAYLGLRKVVIYEKEQT